MLSVERTYNKDDIEHIMYNEDIKKMLFREENPSIDWEKAWKTGVIFYSLKEDDEIIGVVGFLPVFDGMYIVDIGILKEYRGKNAFLLARMAKDIFFTNKDANYILAKIKKNNKRSLYFAANCGMSYLYSTGDYNYLGVGYGRCS